MRKTGLPEIVDCARMASSSDDPHGRFFVHARFWQTLARCARQPRPICTDTHHPYKLNAVSEVNRAQTQVEAIVSGTHLEMPKTVYPQIVDCARMVSSSVRNR
jgi:hypothetical protein